MKAAIYGDLLGAGLRDFMAHCSVQYYKMALSYANLQTISLVLHGAGLEKAISVSNEMTGVIYKGVGNNPITLTGNSTFSIGVMKAMLDHDQKKESSIMDSVLVFQVGQAMFEKYIPVASNDLCLPGIVAPLAYRAKTSSYLATCTHFAKRHSQDIEQVRGALALVEAMGETRPGSSKDFVADILEGRYFYDVKKPIGQFMPEAFGSNPLHHIPMAMSCFFSSSNAEDAVVKAYARKTQGMITGAVAESFYRNKNFSKSVEKVLKETLPPELFDILCKFEEKYIYT